MDTLVNGQQMCESMTLHGLTFFAMSKVSTQEASFRFNWVAAFRILGHFAVGPLDAERLIQFAATHSFQLSNGAKPNRHPFNAQFFVHDFVLNKTIRGANAPMMPISSEKKNSRIITINLRNVIYLLGISQTHGTHMDHSDIA